MFKHFDREVKTTAPDDAVYLQFGWWDFTTTYRYWTIFGIVIWRQKIMTTSEYER